MVQSKQHLKLLYVAKILFEKTDEEHPISIAEIIQELAKADISAERKSIYSDISYLEEFGLDIVTIKDKCNRYYIASRQFELPELKLLADAVCSAKFLTEKKSEQLLHKIEALAGVHEGMLIERQVMVVDRVKSMNEQIYINVDTIHKAINEGKQISFRYFDYSTNKKKVYREGERVCSPCALTWNDEKYYLVSYYLKYPDNFTNFRVDRMSHIRILDEPVLVSPQELNISEYLNSTFSMFSGDTVEAVLKFEKKLINPVIDRFGINADIVNLDINHFKIKANIKAQPPFFAWLFQFGKSASIISPESLKEDYKKMLTEVLSSFDE
ncbi:MAG: helix-turn-helix transcriptional regulator [Oscillospiraceae bacterium]